MIQAIHLRGVNFAIGYGQRHEASNPLSYPVVRLSSPGSSVRKAPAAAQKQRMGGAGSVSNFSGIVSERRQFDVAMHVKKAAII
jgi:hypothetical protein